LEASCGAGEEFLAVADAGVPTLPEAVDMTLPRRPGGVFGGLFEK